MDKLITSKSKRIANLLIDMVLITILSATITLIIPVYDKERLQYIILLLTTIIYYILSEGRKGQSIGKKMTNTKVVFLKKRNKWFWITVRTLLRFNPFDALSYLAGYNNGTHDLLSFTRVVNTDD